MHTIQQLQSGELLGAKQIKISAKLTAIPQELYQLTETLEVLDLSGNALTDLPDDFSRFTKLRILFLSNNNFQEFPRVIGTLSALDIVGFKANQIKHIPEHALPVSLRWLILTDNQLAALPHSIGSCVKLQKVMLAGNQLRSLPDEMVLCTNIELLRISANQFEHLPAWLLTLPKLAWLASAGNPCSFRPAVLETQSNTISWNSIEIKEQLGEGASGMIYKAVLKDTLEEVAVKIYKGAVTSDGLPDDEMKACIQAGLHPNMVPVKAVIADHPDHKQGLVMDLVSSDYHNLGLPPDFVTCTRDTFPPDRVFTISEVLRIARGMLAVIIQLHEKGIMHGDLYAHNILVNKNCDPLFGDFGAATMFSIQDTELRRSLEKIEVRAFGCLLDDLLSRVVREVQSQDDYLVDIKNQCMSEDIQARPTFAGIQEKLRK